MHKAPSGHFARLLLLVALTLSATVLLYGCAMSEEMRRIESVRQAEKQADASRSTNLSGEQLFIRSCNTCHPAGRAGMGPSLADLNEHFPDDVMLKQYIRKGKGIMPGQPKSAMNDEELDNLVVYLRALKVEKN